ncbi:MAG TPA: pirin family protein [Candidatus Nitrosotalea sp.]|nr:pirin family protein [Candidatus Nitrosotalea sp.]
MNATSLSPSFTIVRSGERAHADHGWLDTYYSFSFADYVDPANLNWGALRVFNDDTIAPAAGFPPHPHRDMEIVTYVLSGELAHRDSIGNHGVVKPGGIQFMSAGTGVRHSEYNNSASEPLHLVQMWVIPGCIGTTPSYGEMAFDEAQRRNRWLSVVSGMPAVEAPIRITQNAALRVARLENAALALDFEPQRYGYLFVAEGSVRANGEALKAGDSVRFYDMPRLGVEGEGELVLWDLPALNDDAV